jgi:tape measure domain-containing protein
MAESNVGSIVAKLSVDVSEWQRGLQQAAGQLATFEQGLRGRLTPALTATSQATTAAGQAMQAMSGHVAQATRATSAWSQALHVAAGIGIATSVQGMAQAVLSFGREVVSTGTKLESLRASLGAIAGSSAAGAQQFNFLTQTAQKLGVDLTALATGWRTLTAAASAAGIPVADQQRLLLAVAREAQRTGVSAQGLQQGLLALAQSASKGVVSMEEVRQQLGEQFPTAFAAMAQGLGRTQAELTKLIETGSVSFPQMMRGLTRGWEQMQAGAGQMAETSQQAFSRLGTALTQFKDALAQNILPEMQRVARVAQGILETATNLLKAASGRTGGVQGPTTQELGASPTQQAELDRLTRVIAQLEARQGSGTPLMQETVRTQLANARELYDQVLQTMRGTVDQAAAQAAVTQETNKTTTALENQAEFLAQIKTQTEAVLKARHAFRAEAALAPERLGRPGTPEFLAAEQAALEGPLKKLAEVALHPPAGATLPEAQRRELAALDSQYGQLGQQIDAIREKEQAAAKAAREAEAARKRALQEAAQEQEQYQAAIDRVRMSLAGQQDAAVATLTRLAEAYQHTGEAQDRLTAAKLAAQFQDNEQIQVLAAQVTALSEEAEATHSSYIAIVQRTNALREASDAQEAFQAKLDQATARLQAPKEEREEVQLRLQARTQGIELTPEQEQQLDRLTTLRQEQARLNDVIGVWRDLSQGVGSAWTQALTSIAEHTATVSEAFAAMGKSIMKTMADIAAQKAFAAIFQIGTSLLTSAFLPGGAGAAGGGLALAGGGALGGGGAMAGGGGGGLFAGLMGASAPLTPFQHGGVVNSPTRAILGEAGREHILPAAQFDALRSQAESRAPNVSLTPPTVILVDSRAQAEQMAANERLNGHQVIIREVMADVAKGSGSQIFRGLRQIGP